MAPDTLQRDGIHFYLKGMDCFEALSGRSVDIFSPPVNFTNTVGISYDVVRGTE
jgi:hypothetical protein